MTLVVIVEIMYNIDPSENFILCVYMTPDILYVYLQLKIIHYYIYLYVMTSKLFEDSLCSRTIVYDSACQDLFIMYPVFLY